MTNPQIPFPLNSQLEENNESDFISEKDEKIYAKIFEDTDFVGKSLEDLSYFECDYIFRCIEGLFYGKQIRLRDLSNQILIGSESGKVNFYLQDKEVSSVHCKLTYMEDSFHYLIEDLGSTSGTWIKVLNLEDRYEITENETEFKLFQHEFKIIFNTNINNDKKEIKKNQNQCKILITKGPKEGFEIPIRKGSSLIIGKKEADLNLEMETIDTVVYKIWSTEGKIYVSDETQEYYQEGGLFFKIKGKKMIKAGDVIQIGESIFRILTHNYGFFNELGDRLTQEDKFAIVDDLRISEDIVVPYYAIYDGHGGPSCSEFIKKYLHNEFHYYLKYKDISNSKNFLPDLVNYLQEMILFVDMNYYMSETNFSVHHGSTCVCVFFIGTYALCCNLGDSISILIKKNGKRIYLSRDFSPSRPKENQRIIQTGGYVTKDGRLLGNIAVSRSFGDWKYKDKTKQHMLKKGKDFGDYLISNRAEFRLIEINPKEDNYIILASDGVFQQGSHKDIISCFDSKLDNTIKENGVDNIPNVVDNIRLELINKFYSDPQIRGKSDNITMIFIKLFNEYD